MKKNEGGVDRIVRAIFAAVFFSLGMWYTVGVLSVILFVVAIMMAVTAITGFCPVYPLLGTTTLPKDRME